MAQLVINMIVTLHIRLSFTLLLSTRLKLGLCFKSTILTHLSTLISYLDSQFCRILQSTSLITIDSLLGNQNSANKIVHNGYNGLFCFKREWTFLKTIIYQFMGLNGLSTIANNDLILLWNSSFNMHSWT